MMENGCAILPKLIQSDPNAYYDREYDSCYWSNESVSNEENIRHFVKKAKEYNYTEEQALAILTYNEFDHLKSDCDLKIYKPLKGISKINLKHTVKLISDGIIKNLRSREHRDFDELICHFPGYSIGDLLDFYARNRLKIKKQTWKAKRVIRKINSNQSSCHPNNIKIPASISNGNNGNGFNWLNSENGLFRLVYTRQYNWIKQPESLISQIECDNYGFNIIFSTDNSCNKSRLPDMQLLSYLKKANKNTKYRIKRSKSSYNEIMGTVGLDSEQLCEILDREYKNMDSHKQSAEINENSSFRDKFVHYIKSDFKIYNGEPKTEASISANDEIYEKLCTRHKNILQEYQSIVPKPSVFQKLKHDWSNLDFALLLLGLMRYGLDFSKISDVIITKSEAMIRSFYFNYRHHFNLDKVITINSFNEDILDNDTDVFKSNYDPINLNPKRRCDENDQNQINENISCPNISDFNAFPLVTEFPKMSALSDPDDDLGNESMLTQNKKCIPSLHFPAFESNSETEKLALSSTVEITEITTNQQAESASYAEDNDSEHSNDNQEDSPSAKQQIRKTIETRMSAKSKIVKRREPEYPLRLAHKRGLALVSRVSTNRNTKRSKENGNKNPSTSSENSGTEPDQDDSSSDSKEEQVVPKRVLRDRKSTNERFKTIMDAEKKAKNSKTILRKRRSTSNTTDQETQSKSVKSGRK